MRRRVPKSGPTFLEAMKEMGDAISAVTESHGDYYDQLTDNQVLGYARALYDWHTDLRDEWLRREFAKKIEEKLREEEEKRTK